MTRRLDRDDLEHAPLEAQGTLGKLHQLFGDETDGLMDELNRELVA